MQPTSASDSARWRSLFWPALVVCSAILVAFRLHAFDLPLETDECNYAYIGARLLDGDRLYVDVWDHQPPGVFVLFAAVIAVLGDAPEVFRWMAALFSLASLFLVMAIARRITGTCAAVLAGILFALVSSDPGTGGEGVNREIYMNTLILAGWWCVLTWIRSCSGRQPESASDEARKRSWLLFAAGLALAIGSCIKTVIAVHWLALAVWLAIVTLKETKSARRTIATVLAFGAAPFILWAASFMYFAATARLTEFVDAVFLFNLSYSEGRGFDRFVTFFDPPRHPFVFESAGPLWMVAAVAVAWLTGIVLWKRDRRAALVLVLLLAGFIAVCMPAHFWPHYYYLLVPPTIIAASVLLSDVARWIFEHNRSFIGIAEAAMVLVMLPIGLVATEYDAYLSQPAFGITIKRYNSRDFWGRAQAENVRRVTNPGDMVFVYGNEAEIYYYSGRRCASRYTMLTALGAGMAGAERRREILISELQRNPPRLILLLFDQPPFPEWKQFLAEHYTEQPVGADLHDKTGEAIMLVLARKDAPIEAIDWNWDRSQVGGWEFGEQP